MIDTTSNAVRTLVIPRYDYNGHFIGRYVYDARMVVHGKSGVDLMPVMCEVETWGQKWGEPDTLMTAWDACIGQLSKLPENKHLGTVRKLSRWQLASQHKPTTFAFYQGGSFVPDQSRGHFYFGGAGGSFFHLDCTLVSYLPN